MPKYRMEKIIPTGIDGLKMTKSNLVVGYHAKKEVNYLRRVEGGTPNSRPAALTLQPDFLMVFEAAISVWVS